MIKWIVRIVVALVVIIAAGLIYIEVNKKELLALAVEEANKSINGTLTYDDADISLFKSFPDLKVSLYGTRLADKAHIDDLPLINAGEISVDLNLVSAFKKDLVINSFSLSDAVIYVANYKDGSTNYDLAPPADDPGTSQNVDFDISTYSMDNVDFIYADHAAGQKTSFKAMEVEGKLSYKKQYIYMINELNGGVELAYGSMLPLYNASISGVVENTINPTMDSIGINRSELLFNDLPIRLSGDIRVGEDIAYNLDFGSPATEIKRLISLLPNFYKNQYKDLVSQGTYVLNGTLNGNTKNDFPLYKISVMTKDGQLYYPDLDARIDKMDMSILVENTNVRQAYTKLIVDGLDIKSGKSAIKGDLSSMPNGDSHNLDFDFDGDIDFADFSKSLVLDANTILEGVLKGKIAGAATVNPSSATAMVSDQKFNADISLDGIKYKDVTTDLNIKNTTIKGDKTKLSFKSSDVIYNDALDFDAEGYINNPLSVLLDTNYVVTGDIQINAGKVNMDKLSTVSPDSITVATIYDIPNTDLFVKFTAQEIRRGEYLLEDVRTSGKVSEDMSKMNFVIEKFNGSRFIGSANLRNMLSYSLNGATLNGDVELTSDKLDLNEFMKTGEGQTTPVAVAEELIPSNLNLKVDYKADEIVFKNIDIAKSLGNVSIGDKKITFENRGAIFGGEVALTGTFDTDREDGYHISLVLDLKGLGFSQTASNLKLFTQILPIAKFIEGEYNAALSWSSDLDKNYMPDLNSLTAKGVIQTKGGKIDSKLPIDTFLQRFNIAEKTVKPIQISDANKYFIIEDGKVVVKDIEFKKGDISISMEGTHSFSQQLDYSLKIDVPKKIANVGNVLSFIQDKVKFGDKIKAAGDNVSLQVDATMGGSLLKPKFGVKGLSLKSGDQVESIEDMVVNTFNDAKDSLETVLRDTINAVKDKVVKKVDSVRTAVTDTINATKEKVKEAIDSTKTVVKEEIDKKKDEVTKAGGGILDDIKQGKIDSVKVNVDDIFKQNKGALDSLRLKLPTKALFPKLKKN